MSYQYNENQYSQGGASYGEASSASYAAEASYGSASASSAAAAVIGAGGSTAIAAQSFEGYIAQEPAPIDISSIQLPPPNMQCYQEPPQPRPEVKYFKVEEPAVTKSITQNFNTSKTVVKENTIHTQHIKNVIINVNRNHWHTQRVVLKDNNYHHYLINNVIRVADVHHQKIEQVKGESKNFNDYKQTQRVEAATCERGQDSVGQISGGAAAALSSSDESAVASLIAGAGNGVATNVKTTTTTTAFGTGSSQAYTANSGASYGYSSNNYGSSQQYNY